MSPLSLLLLPFIDNENQFFLLREKLLAQPTAKQTQVTMNAAAVELIDHTISTNAHVKQAVIKRDGSKFKNNLFVHCTHEQRLQGLAREIHTIHDSYFKNTHVGHVRLIVGHRNNPNIEYELSRKRPSSHLLMDPLKPKSESI